MFAGNNRRQHRAIAAISILVLTVSAFAAEAGGGPVPLPIVGRWDITRTEGNRQKPSWISIQENNGKLTARFVGSSGGMYAPDPPKFEHGILTFTAGKFDWTGKLNGDTIEGTCKKGHTEAKWTARRFTRKIDVSGKWELQVGDKKVLLELVDRGNGIVGKWTEHVKDIDISNGRLANNELTFNAGNTLRTMYVKGDIMEGKDGEKLGTRQRAWGKPVILFAGKPEDLNNWGAMDDSNFTWKIADGALTNGRPRTENIVTKRKDFQNFKLHAEFKVPPAGNSGVYLRGRYEIQIADSFGQPPKPDGCGSLYTRIAPAVNASKKADEWQTLEIELIDGYLSVAHNGTTIIANQEVEGITGGAIDSNEGEPGPIFLQGDHSQIWYRNIILTPAK